MPDKVRWTEGTTTCFNVRLHVSLHEMREWHPDRIAQFFRGITTAIMAREGIPLMDAPQSSAALQSPAQPLARHDEGSKGGKEVPGLKARGETTDD